MNRKYLILALLIISVLVLSSCKQSGAAAGSAPRTPFIGGTAGVSMNFEKDSPPPEVTDDQSFAFNAIVSLKMKENMQLTATTCASILLD